MCRKSGTSSRIDKNEISNSTLKFALCKCIINRTKECKAPSQQLLNLGRIHLVLDSGYSSSYRNDNSSNSNDNNDKIFNFCSNWDLWTFIQKFEIKMNTFKFALWNEAMV